MLFLLCIVFPDLVDVIPASLHVSIIIVCAVLILFSSVCSAFFMYNAFGNPYETLHGPLGLYLWNLISCEPAHRHTNNFCHLKALIYLLLYRVPPTNPCLHKDTNTHTHKYLTKRLLKFINVNLSHYNLFFHTPKHVLCTF